LYGCVTWSATLREQHEPRFLWTGRNWQGDGETCWVRNYITLFI
jgi:hypothetical protein